MHDTRSGTIRSIRQAGRQDITADRSKDQGFQAKQKEPSGDHQIQVIFLFTKIWGYTHVRTSHPLATKGTLDQKIETACHQGTWDHMGITHSTSTWDQGSTSSIGY